MTGVRRSGAYLCRAGGRVVVWYVGIALVFYRYRILRYFGAGGLGEGSRPGGF